MMKRTYRSHEAMARLEKHRKAAVKRLKKVKNTEPPIIPTKDANEVEEAPLKLRKLASDLKPEE
jgi:hypothetical protein